MPPDQAAGQTHTGGRRPLFLQVSGSRRARTWRGTMVTGTLMALLGACAAASPAPSSSPISTPSSSLALRCLEAGPSIDRAAPVSESSGIQPAGRALLVDPSGRLHRYEGGRFVDIPAPYPVREHFARLAPDGHVVAILAGPGPTDVSLWMEPTASTPELLSPLPAANDSYVIWSPGANRALYVASTSTVIVIDAKGQQTPLTLGGRVFGAGIWRSDDELTFVTTSSSGSFPLTNATIWSWRPSVGEVPLTDHPISLTAPPRWSPDGQILATIEQDAFGRSVHLRDPHERLLLGERDLAIGPNGCARDPLQLIGLQWSPDSKTLAIVAHGVTDWVGLTDVATARVHAFAAPADAGCFIPPQFGWSGQTVIVPLLGPSCGQAANGLSNVLALIDLASGALEGYVAIPRKGFLGSAGRWIGTVASDDPAATTFFSLDASLLRRTFRQGLLIDFQVVP